MLGPTWMIYFWSLTLDNSAVSYLQPLPEKRDLSPLDRQFLALAVTLRNSDNTLLSDSAYFAAEFPERYF